MARIIVVTSGKGGVGKTTVVANLGFALASLNLKTLLLDIDLGLNNLDVVMGVENKIVYDIIDVLEKKCRAKQALIQDIYQPNLFIFPSTHTYSSINIETAQIKEIIAELEPFFDYILIDCPAGIENGFFRAIEIAREAIVVTTPHISAIRDADKIIGFLENMNILNPKLIVNRVRGDLIISGDMIAIDSIKSFLNIELLGVVPEDDLVTSQLLYGGAVLDKGDFKNSFNLISSKLHNGTTNVFDCTRKYKGIFGSIRRELKRKI